MLIDYIRNPKFGYLFSFIVGVGLIVVISGNGCVGDACVRYKAPPVADVNDAVYKFKNKCFKFKTDTTDCTGAVVESFKGAFADRLGLASGAADN